MPAAKNTETKTTPRTNATQLLGIDIAVARTRAHMKAVFAPVDTEAELKSKRAVRDELKQKPNPRASDTKKIAALDRDIKAITSKIVRIGGESQIVVAVAADVVVKSLIRHAMDQTLSTDHKTADLKALHGPASDTIGDLSSLGVWPLIRDLPAVANYSPEHELALKAQRAAASRAAKDAKDAGVAVPNLVLPKEDGDDSVSTRFTTYVKHAETTVKEDGKYANMRVATSLRENLATIVAQFVKSISVCAQVVVLKLLNVRTLTADHLVSVFEALFEFSGVAPDTQAEILDVIRDKLCTFRAHVESEQARRIQEMSADELAEMAAKKKAATMAKVAKLRESYREKAVKYAGLAKSAN